MHRFMNHLDELAGLDVVIARSERGRPVPTGLGCMLTRLRAYRGLDARGSDRSVDSEPRPALAGLGLADGYDQTSEFQAR